MTKKTINDCNEVAKSKGGRCLSREYINSKIKMKWQCSYGHTWLATFQSINRKIGTWCPHCKYESIRNTIEGCCRIAESRSGKCLSEKYTNNITKLKWECAMGHICFGIKTCN